MVSKSFFDAGVNIADKMFRGFYNGKFKHEADIIQVVKRGLENGVEKMVVLGGTYEESREVLQIIKDIPNIYATVGCHPTNCNFYRDGGEVYTENLKKLIKENDRVVAVGECGLDYDREQFCDRETQKIYFEKQIEIAAELNLPLYLHCRAAHDDLIKLIIKHRSNLLSAFPGIVHTFDGTYEQADSLISLGFFLGINGCSLKTYDNLEVVKQLPLTSLILETDCPWCEVRPSHAGYKYIRTFPKTVKKEKWSAECQVKGRNEPANIVQIFEILCGIRSESEEEICNVIFKNTDKLFCRNFI